MEEAIIRRAERGDKEPLGVLWTEFLAEQAALDARFCPAEDALERWQNDFDGWLRDDGYAFFVAERGAALVGFATAERWAPPPVYAASFDVHLDELFVVPSARGRGLGRRLVEAVTAWAGEVGAARLRLGVLAANAAGRGFWERRAARPFSITYTIAVEGTRPPPKKHRLGF